MNRFRKTITLGLALALAASAAGAAETQRAPNVLLILADDLGWRDLACYGNPVVQTPNIDALARQGVRFTQAYAYPTCSPSRVAILTGEYPSRYRLATHIKPHRRAWAKLKLPETNHALPLDAVTIADILAPRGYTLTLIGKWHLGYGDNPFDLGRIAMPPGTGPASLRCAFGFKAPPRADARSVQPGRYEHRLQEFVARNPEKSLGVHIAQAVRFMEAQADQPFFCFLSLAMVHGPWDRARADLRNKYGPIISAHSSEIAPNYAAMIDAMDEGVGLVLEVLRELGLEERTLVVFFSDNGAATRSYANGPTITTNHPLRGEKGTLFEGGIRVPLIVRWPGEIHRGEISGEPVLCTDLLPTFADVAGAPLPADYERDGVSWLAHLRGNGELPHRNLYWHMPTYTTYRSSPSSAVRAGKYKLIEYLEDAHVELYDLEADPAEATDLAALQPTRALELRRQLHSWRHAVGAEMPPPNPDYDPVRADVWTERPAKPWLPASSTPLPRAPSE